MLRALMAVAIMAAMAGFARGRNYVVGAPTGGWDISTNYTLWASTKTFYPGDTLTFLYGSSHDVLEVTSVAYGSCGAPSNPISSDKSGNTTVALKAAGTRYFICGTAGHCRSGMKMAVRSLVGLAAALPATGLPARRTRRSAVASVPALVSFAAGSDGSGGRGQRACQGCFRSRDRDLDDDSDGGGGGGA
ncbi:unnamed protein product, partial [Musa textilis]